jgi:hemerythrin-like domain-containing protein
MAHRDDNRRTFLQASIAVGLTTVISGCGRAGQGSKESNAATEKKDKESKEEDDVTPSEDLMREHGVLKRVLLVYGEGIRRLEAGEDLPPDAIAAGAGIIRSFIEDYHEKLEEDHLFPRFRKAHMHEDLVETLVAQHQAGRRLTDRTLQLATLSAVRDSGQRGQLVASLRAFIRMYEPHEAREDTVLFPALRKIVSRQEFAALGEDFEKIEHEKFGEGGFEQMVDRVATIEKTLGIYELSKFTPVVEP